MLSKDNASFRTLIGPNIFFDGVGAIAEIYIDRASCNNELIALYEENIYLYAKQINFKIEELFKRVYSKGIIFAVASDFDLVYVAREILEVAFDKTLADIKKEPLSEKIDSSLPHVSEHCNDTQDFDVEASVKHLESLYAKEYNLFLQVIYLQARARELEISLDENILSLGSGSGLYQVDLTKDKTPNIPWENIYNIPSVAITGSNGKTTTVILTKCINEQSGKTVAYSSTERVMIGNEIIEEGDLSGPYGARTILNNKNVDVAVLEFARGGIARRGVGINYVDAAIVVNVSKDHLGLNGIDDIYDLANAKFLVHKAVKKNGYSIVNLDDEMSLLQLDKLSKNKIFISQKADFAILEKQIVALYNKMDSDLSEDDNLAALDQTLQINDIVCYIAKDILTIYMQQQHIELVNIKDIPLTFNGMAKHNIENILAATALSLSLKCDLPDIKNGLVKFNATELNKGRFNIFNMKNYQNTMVIVDYAHNLASVEHIIKFAKNAIGDKGQITLVIGLTGDRIFMIDEMSQLIVANKVDFLMIKTFNSRLRGAELGEVANLMHHSLIRNGFKEKNILPTVDTEIEAVEQLLLNLKDNHAYIVLSQDDIEEVIQKIQDFNS